ncbi:hypothetical protein OGM63_08765 [Plectonema radiosum NIES-515]|uniref:Uncharacterized protein n=1 Tax=Plectonema radiosum NIES-515 TaxID=2986073 RepID=A0ABT3AWX3_9CYAN|nr:hypothetical protein [Plectonema radiosum]MCV3213616.1 hypothetical protein [Plectonema radiosum NIES-515]
MVSEPQLWNNWKSGLWVRFFLLTVFATHTLTVFERAAFYESIPLTLNTNHPEFFSRLEKCSENNLKIGEINASDAPKIIKLVQKLPLLFSIIWNLLRIYLFKPIDAESSRATVS